MPVQNLRQFLQILRQERDLVTIDAEVDPCLEIAEIHRRVIEQHGPALLFNRVKDSSFPVVTNLFGTPKRIELAFGAKPQQLVKQIVHFAETLLPPKFSKLWENRNLALEALKLGTSSVKQGPVLEVVEQPADLNRLPILTTWQQDGGPFITLPLVYTEHPKDKRHNLGHVPLAAARCRHDGHALADRQRRRISLRRRRATRRGTSRFSFPRWTAGFDSRGDHAPA